MIGKNSHEYTGDGYIFDLPEDIVQAFRVRPLRLIEFFSSPPSGRRRLAGVGVARHGNQSCHYRVVHLQPQYQYDR